jgi:hypothetical protein
MRLITDMVGLHFAHDPKEIHVEPRILGTRPRITRADRDYRARVPSRWWQSVAANGGRRRNVQLGAIGQFAIGLIRRLLGRLGRVSCRRAA